MQLTPKNIKLKKIILDPFNPRFVDQTNLPQEEIIAKILRSASSKELLRSMQIGIKWVNRIVVQKVEYHPHASSLSSNLKAEYIVIEGNTRMACLKSGKIEDFKEDASIPVLLAEKSDEESIDEFRQQVRITQGIANVTVVKDWSPLSKARHLNNLYNDLARREPDKKPSALHKQISTELGLKINDVRDGVLRYMIYTQIDKISDTIPENQWGYLEAFSKNSEIRQKIGISPSSNEFVETEEEDHSSQIIEIGSLCVSRS